MRQAKRAVTPRLLDLFRRQERGIGTLADYTAWNRVRRSDPPSPGRSHLHRFRGRQVDLMSDLELTGFYFANLVPGLSDIREHYPLSLTEAPHELSAYDAAYLCRLRPGTLDIALQLHRKHPQAKDAVEQEPNVLTTQQLLTLRTQAGRYGLIAVSYCSRMSRRASSALAIERRYWVERDVPWLLVTYGEFDRRVGLTLRRTACWALSPAAPSEAVSMATSLAEATQGRPLTKLLLQLSALLGDMDRAQCAFWQAVWTGAVPLDLRRGWRPTEPLQLMARDAWASLNPIASGRSAWNS